MTADEAETLARRVLNAGRGTGPLDEWRRVLGRHELKRATRTVDRLVDAGGHNLTIRGYLDEYRALDPDRYGFPKPEDTGPPTSLHAWLESLPGDELEHLPPSLRSRL
jgi:hypothetical protein